MSRAEITAALRKEEKRRRAHAKARAKEIEALMEEQDLDRQGKLWGEKSFEEFAAAEGVRWSGDLVGRLCPYRLTPEDMVIRFEELSALESRAKALGERAVRLVGACLDAGSPEELSREIGIPMPELLRQLWALVKGLFGQETAGSLAEFIRQTASGEAMKEHRFLFQEETKVVRVRLTAAARELSVDKLHAAMLAAGYNVSRPTAHRGKRQGWFCPDYNPGEKRPATTTRQITGYVILKRAERKLSVRALAAQMGISQPTASAAKRRGYFAVTQENKNKIRVSTARIKASVSGCASSPA
jgi:AraC-like DNA-binding protein